MSFEFIKKLPTPDEIREQYPVPKEFARLKALRDKQIRDVITGESDRFLVIIGPCSADNEDAVCDYISRLAKVNEKVSDRLILIPRIYTNKPRTTGEGYKGHSFWDTEMFLLPHYLLTDPPAARTLLEYRWRSLPGAFKKARENDWQGAMFPWESAWLTDGEVTPLFGAADVVTGQSIPILTGMLEHHITADVAWAVWLYYLATGDDDFMEKFGCDLLVNTACFWASRLEWKRDAGRFEICNVIGPDEYKEHVDNNAFTNYLAAENLRVASLVIGRMRRDWPAAWRKSTTRRAQAPIVPTP